MPAVKWVWGRLLISGFVELANVETEKGLIKCGREFKLCSFLSFISTGYVCGVHMKPEPPPLIDGKLIKLANSSKIPELQGIGLNFKINVFRQKGVTGTSKITYW
jgi:hypothetical protein